MTTETTTPTLAQALVAAQTEIENTGKNAVNGFFQGRKYADLSAVRDSIVPIFNKHGIAVIQELTSPDHSVGVKTILVHGATGERMEFGPMLVPVGVKADAQAYGTAATYGRRYTLQAIGGNTGRDEDDDANAISGAPAKSANDIPAVRSIPKPSAPITPEAAAKIAAAEKAFSGKTWRGVIASVAKRGLSNGKEIVDVTGEDGWTASLWPDSQYVETADALTGSAAVITYTETENKKNGKTYTNRNITAINPLPAQAETDDAMNDEGTPF